jgi:hypothetical protein
VLEKYPFSYEINSTQVNNQELEEIGIQAG